MLNTIKLYDNKTYGVKVSKYGLENGYLDYRALDKIIGPGIMNNNIYSAVEGWEIMNGDPMRETFQDYIISERGYRFLEEHTDEIVWYNNELDLYLWSVDHLGASWDHVLTDIKIEKGD